MNSDKITAVKQSIELSSNPVPMTTDQVLAQARLAPVDEPAKVASDNPAPADAASNQGASNQNRAPSFAQAVKAQQPAATSSQAHVCTPAEAHLLNAGILYAKAAACFEGVYMSQVLAAQLGAQR